MDARVTLEALRVALRADDRTEAERLAGAVLAHHARDVRALHVAGTALLAAGYHAAAVALLEASLGNGNGDAESWNDLGVALQRCGHLDRAAAAYRAALEHRPNDPRALANLAAVLSMAGAYEEAHPYAVRAAALLPELADAQTTLAVIEGALVSAERALARLETLLARTPHDVPALTATIATLRKLERFPEAFALALRRAAFAPDDGASDVLVGATLRDLGRTSEAIAAYDRAIARPANPAAAWASKADTLLDLGDLAAAEKHFARAVAIEPALAAGWFGLAQIRALDAAEIATVEGLLAAPDGGRREHRMLLFFALGRALSAQPGAEARAVAAFDSGNALARAAFAYDVRDDERRAEAIVRTCDRPAMARLAGDGRASSPAAPIFVLGMPRSGTSLVEAILASHPDVYGAGELPALRLLIEEQLPFPQSLDSLDADAVAALGARYASAIATLAPDARRIVDKMPSNYVYAGLVHAMLPRARIIHCMRDSLDTAWSCYTGLFSGRQDFAYEQTELGRYWRAYRRVTDHWRTIVPAHAWLDVRYEDVVNDFDATAGALFAWCDLTVPPTIRSFYDLPRRVTTASRVEVRRPLFRSSVGRARRFAPYLEPLIAALRGDA